MSFGDALSVGEAAKRVGIDMWQINALLARKLVPSPGRFGRYRVIREADLDAVREAAERVGYLKPALAGAGAA